MSDTTLHGLFPVVPTPMRNGEVDVEGIERLVAAIAPALEGITILGSNGESGYLSQSKRLRTVTAYASAAAEHNLRVIAGVTTAVEDDARQLAAEATSAGVVALLVLPPTYLAATAEVTERRLAAVAAVTDVALLHYDIPFLTGLALGVDELVAIRERVPSLVGTKISHSNLNKIRGLHDAGFVSFAGNDALMHEQVVEGCQSVMAPSVAVAPAAAKRWFDALRAGDVERAFVIYNEELGAIARTIVTGAEPDFVAVVKHLLTRTGALAGDERVSGVPGLSAARARQVDATLAYVTANRPAVLEPVAHVPA